ncbi:hypothetical protein L6R50_04195 [Myxococcota bacterium]|nr:hypothetical protein [Myxococcota bacterium]
MKDQYFGDINDYRKYGLLRVLKSGGGSLQVAWMLTPDDGGRDGGSRSYLDDPDRWAGHDPDLYHGLRDLLASSLRGPSVTLLERSDLLPGASYHSVRVPDGRRARDSWSEDLLRAASGTDLVFLDPDIGIEIPSCPAGRAGSSGYVTWREVEGLWAAGSSVLIYQHYRREPRRPFAERLAGELRSRTGGGLVEAFHTPHVLFLLAAQDRHAGRFGAAIPSLRQRWRGQIEPLGLADLPTGPMTRCAR